MEVAGLILSYVESISTLLSFSLGQKESSSETLQLFEDAQESAKSIERSVDVAFEKDDEEAEGQLQDLVSRLPDIRTTLSDSRNVAEVGEAVDWLRAEGDRLSKVFLGEQPSLSEPVDREGVSKDLALPDIVFTDTSLESEFLQQCPDGLQLIHRPKGADSDIILVHGLGEDAWSAWSGQGAPNVFWPRDFLPADMKNSAIWLYCYNGGLDMRSATQGPIKEKLETIADKLRYAVESSTRGRIIWIAHSLGGLIVKCCLTRSRSQLWPPHEDAIFSRTQGVIFIGTPHSGSSPTSRAARFINILSVFSGFHPALRHESLLGEQLFDSTITHITSDFAALMDEQDFRIVSLYETKPLPTDSGPRMIVEKFTYLKHPQEKVGDLEGNHVTACKFVAREERGYQTLLRSLRELSMRGSDASFDEAGIVTSPTVSSVRSVSDAETMDVAALYAKFRWKVDVPAARWRSVKSKSYEDGRWFLETDDYIQWRDRKIEKPLLITGPVGCGKSMIAESILQDVRSRCVKNSKSARICHLHLFFRSDQVAQQSPSSILAAFIAQTLDQNNALARHVRPGRVAVGDQTNLAQALLQVTLRRMLEDRGWSAIYLVIDALDECDLTLAPSISAILSWILRIPKVYAICTASTSDGLGNRLDETSGTSKKCKSLLSLLEDSMKDSHKANRHQFKRIPLQSFEPWRAAIKDYLDDKLNICDGPKHEARRDGLKMSHENRLLVKKSLLNLPHISFSFADLAIQYLRHQQESSRTILFEPLLQELNDAVKLHISLINLANNQPASCLWAISVLAWALEPLRVSELSILWHFDANSEFIEPVHLEREAQTMLKALTSAEMKRLIYVDGDGLHLATSTVRRVLQWEMTTEGMAEVRTATHERLSPVSESLPFDDYQAIHSRMARSCLRLLLHNRERMTFDADGHSHWQQPLPAKDYARKHWSHHVSEAGEAAISLTGLISRFEATQSSPGGSPTTGPRSPFSKSRLLMRLVRKNLFVTVGSIFEEDVNKDDTPDQDPIDTVLDSLDSSQAPRPEVLHVLRKINSHTSDSGGNQKAKRDLKLGVVEHIQRDDPEALVKDLRRSIFRPEELASFLKVAVEQQSEKAAACILLELSRTPPESKGKELLELAVKFGNRTIVQHMLKFRDLFELHAGLFAALEAANINICEDILMHGANVNSAEGSESPLHRAAAIGLVDAVLLLLKWNAYVNARDGQGRTPLHLAAENGHEDIIVTLLHNSASLTAQDDMGRTPFFSACACGQSRASLSLRIAGSGPWEKDHTQRTILHAVAENGHEDIVEMLLRAGLDPNARDKWDATPLHKAAEGGWASIVQRLLKAGADPMIRAHKLEFELSNAKKHELKRSSTDEMKQADVKKGEPKNGSDSGYLSWRTGEIHEESLRGRQRTILPDSSATIEPRIPKNDGSGVKGIQSGSDTAKQRDKVVEDSNTEEAALEIAQRKEAGDEQRTSIVHFACRSSNAPETVLELLMNHDAYNEFEAVDGHGRTPALIAAQFSTVRALKRLSMLKSRNGDSLLSARDSEGRDINHYVQLLEDPRGRTSPQEVAERKANRKEKVSFLKAYFEQN